MRRQQPLRCALVRFVHARCGVVVGRGGAAAPRRDAVEDLASAAAGGGEALRGALGAFVRSGQPVVLRGFWPRGPPRGERSGEPDEEGLLPRMRQLCGHREVLVRLPHRASATGGGPTFGDGAARAPYAAAERRLLGGVLDELGAPGAASCYVANVSLATLPELAEHLQPLSREVAFLGGAAFGEAVLGTPALYAGKGGQRTPLHFDPTENLTIVLQGTKHVRLFPPSASPFLRPVGGVGATAVCWLNAVVPAVYSEADAWAPELARGVGAVDVELQAGDLLYLPVAWWHAVAGSDDANVTIVFGFAPSEVKGARHFAAGPRRDLFKWLPTALAMAAGFWWTSGEAPKKAVVDRGADGAS